MALTEKQKRFVDEYLIDLNATRAYKVAYPSCKKDTVAATNGGRLLRNAEIKEYIEKRIKERERRTEITQDMVLKELAAIAFTDITEIVNTDGEEVYIKPTVTLSDVKKKAISSIKQTKDGIEIKFHDKEKALEMLGRHLGMFKDKVEVSGDMKVNNPYAELTTEDLKKLIGGDATNAD